MNLIGWCAVRYLVEVYVPVLLLQVFRVHVVDEDQRREHHLVQQVIQGNGDQDERHQTVLKDEEKM